MRTPPIWQILLRRDDPDLDCGFKPLPCFELPTDDELTTTLLAYHNGPKLDHRPPTIADVIDDNGDVVKRARVWGDYAKIEPAR